MTNKRRRLLTTALCLVSAASPLRGQSGTVARSDPITALYSGFITWTNSSVDSDGIATEMARVSIVDGVVDCDVGYTSPGHSAGATGRGMLIISLGEKPSPPAKGSAYSFRVACPDPEYTDRVRPARWSHMMESYEQPGGAVAINMRTKKPIYPPTLKGSRTDNGGGSSSTITWWLCIGCSPVPQPPPPATPPPPFGPSP